MLIVDAQIHLWNAGNPTTPWHRQIPAYTKADALSEMDAGGLDAAVLTPHTPCCHLLGVAARHPS